MCGTFLDPSTGHPSFLVTAGNTTDILDLDTLTWSEAPALPAYIKDATSVPFGDTFLVVGGMLPDSYIADTVYEYDVQGRDWITRPERLPIARGRGTGVVVVSSNAMKCVEVE